MSVGRKWPQKLIGGERVHVQTGLISLINMSGNEPFFVRWWRRKTAADDAERPPAVAEMREQAPSEVASSCSPPSSQFPGTEERGVAQTNAEGDFADFAFEALGADSDYTRFLGPDVPDAARAKALARLWRSHPAFAQADPLQDYARDFTDEATANPDDVLQTAYRIGRGFITEEVDRESEGEPAPSTSEPGPPGRK